MRDEFLKFAYFFLKKGEGRGTKLLKMHLRNTWTAPILDEVLFVSQSFEFWTLKISWTHFLGFLNLKILFLAVNICMCIEGGGLSRSLEQLKNK